MSFEESSDIAIIGMAGRFPGAADVAAFWRNLEEGVESIRFFTDEELLAAGVDPALLADPKYVKASPVVDGHDEFDASYFGFSPREAAVMDPQHRLMLESCVGALEDAACDPARFDGRIGVFAGSAMNTYFMNRLAGRFREEYLPTLIGNDKDFLATRVAYKLDLTGPALTVQTACSTSLVALHLACQALLNEECDMALAGGVSVRIPQHTGHLHEEQSVYTPDGHCRPFDEKAAGTIFGSGVGVVALKRVADAVRDGDHVYAVVKGSAVNNDGSTKADYTAPSVAAQGEVIAEALAVADVDPETIGYVEAHGTGTYLGDPIEVEALTKAFRASTEKTGFCALGSVKGNIGHLDAAAGVTGVIKAALALERGVVPPSINYAAPNPQIDFARTPFFVNTERRPWPRGDAPRRAGVTSLGIGGTNAHAILEEAPAAPASGDGRRCDLLVLSAKSEAALDEASARLADHLEARPDVALADVAHTLRVGRTAHEHRRAIACDGRAAALAALRDPGARGSVSGRAPARREAVFMFSGQGAQYVDMARGVHESEPVFGDALARCAELFEPHLGRDLRTLIYPAEEDREAAAEELRQTSLTQPALFAIEYALARLWMAWGVAPAALVGHSIGEYVAACLAGVFTLEDAVALVAARGQLMQEMAPGAMRAVNLDEGELERRLTPGVSIAAVNAPGLCVVSGDFDAMARFEKALAADGLEARELKTSHAFHSEMMEPALPRFTEAVAGVERRAPTIPFLSNLTGDWITDEQATDPAYWAQHLRRAVRFADCAGRLLAREDAVLLEVGPGRTLQMLVQSHADRTPDHVVLASTRHPKRADDDLRVLLAALGEAWAAGVDVDWDAFADGRELRRVPLPTYPFQRQRYWIEEASTAGDARAPALYLPTWRHAPDRAAPVDDAARWLLLADEDGPGDELAARLRARGHTVAVARAGAGFAAAGDGAWTVAPAADADYDRLLADTGAPAHVVHVWGTGADDADRLFHAQLALARALTRAGVSDAVAWTVVTQGVFDVTGDEAIVPERALARGPALVLGEEYPHVTARHVDIAPGVDAARLAAELALPGAERTVALRGRRRWVPHFAPLAPDGASPLREGGVYLVTGGLGGVGRLVADHLARTYGAKLVLTSRSADPARARPLEEAGAEVLVRRADATDAARMREVVAEAVERFGALHGVIHAAGLADDAIVETKERAAAARVLAPKVAGTRALADALDGVAPDFVLLFSSITSHLAPAGTVDYAAANAHLDAFAAARGAPFTSVCWPGLRGVGMIAERETPEALRPLDLTPGEAVALLERALAAGQPRLLAAARDFGAALAAHEAARATPAGGAAQAPDAHARPAGAAEFVAPEGEVEEALAAMWSELLGVHPIGSRDNFADLGGHSLLATQVVTRLRKDFQVDVTIKDMFDNPTLGELAVFVEEAILADLEQLSAAEGD